MTIINCFLVTRDNHLIKLLRFLHFLNMPKSRDLLNYSAMRAAFCFLQFLLDWGTKWLCVSSQAFLWGRLTAWVSFSLFLSVSLFWISRYDIWFYKFYGLVRVRLRYTLKVSSRNAADVTRIDTFSEVSSLDPSGQAGHLSVLCASSLLTAPHEMTENVHIGPCPRFLAQSS